MQGTRAIVLRQLKYLVATIQDVLNALEEIAPARFAYSFDKIGLQIGDPSAPVERAVVSLDRSLGAVNHAVKHRADLLLCHHPLIWEPMSAILSTSHAGKAAIELIRHGIAFIAAHTNWDAAIGGINDTLATLLGLQNAHPCGSGAQVSQLKLVVFAPEADAEKVIEAASQAGAGVIGLYSRCAFHHPGTGTYLGGEGTNPTIGRAGRVESAPEIRVEMVLAASRQHAVADAVRRVHSYDEPAFDFYRLTEREEQQISRIGDLGEALPFHAFAAYVDAALNTRCSAWGAPERPIARVAVCGGAAADEWVAAQAAGADAFVTGEVPQHVALEASESGLAIIAAGHYQTEHPGCLRMRDRLAERVSNVEWLLFEPQPGLHGRPL